MAWLYLFLAGIFEICWATGLKYCDGFKINLAIIFVALTMVLSVVFLGLAARTLPIGIAYAAWTGLGIAGVFIYSALVFKDPISSLNIIFVTMILFGVIGLKLSSK